MGFDFSAVTALLGGYDKSERRDFDAGAERRRRQGGRRGSAAPSGNEPSSTGPAHADAHPITSGAGFAVNGIGRALDALISVEETRRRKDRVAQKAGEETGSLSAALKASLPPPNYSSPIPSDDALTRRAGKSAASEPERDWDEIRSLIDALATAERSVQKTSRPDDARGETGELRPFRPTTFVSKA